MRNTSAKVHEIMREMCLEFREKSGLKKNVEKSIETMVVHDMSLAQKSKALEESGKF